MTGSPCLTLTKSPLTTNAHATLIRVAVPTPLRRTFDYLLTHEFLQHSIIGCRVRVPFGRRQLIGWVLEENIDSELPTSKLKPILERLDDTPLLSATLLDLLRWASDYYQYPIGEVIDTAVPTFLRQGKPLHALDDMAWQITPEGLNIAPETLKRAPKQQLALQLLAKAPIPLHQLSTYGLQTSVLTKLAEKNWCVCHSQPQSVQSHLIEVPKLTLTDEQQDAVNSLCKNFNQFQTYVLEGVTGSGKTMVYVAAIAACLQQGKQALVLVPEIGLTPQTVARFKKIFNTTDISVIHSNLSDKERALAWSKAKRHQSGIIIGTRSAVFTPLARPGIFIVDEEHDLSYKQQDHFRYSARDILIRRAQIERCPVVLGSATLSLETYHNCQRQKYHKLALTHRYGHYPLPKVNILDIRHQKLQAGLSAQLIQAIESTLAQKKQVLLFINRRGFAPVLYCVQCQWVQLCPFCDAKMIVHMVAPQLRCHHCDYKRHLPTHCPSCHTEKLQPVGLGTQRLEAALQTIFKNARLMRLDKDSMAKKQSFELALKDIHDGNIDIMIGTQMLAKGHHFSNVTLVAMLNIDQALFSVDFRAIERLAQLITQVSGRAGRETQHSQVFLQTCQPHHPLLTELIQKGYPAFLKVEYEQRRGAQLPPFQYQALFRADSHLAQTAETFLEHAKQLALEHSHEGSVWGPVLAPMGKKQGRYRAQLMIQMPTRQRLHIVCQRMIADLERLPSHQIRWSVDIDPLDML